MRTSWLSFALAVLVLTGCAQHLANWTKGVSSICQVHGEQMTKTNVPIVYGLFCLSEWGKDLQAAGTNGFPHADEEVLGGCILNAPTRATIYVCSRCQRARRQWELAHPHP